MQHIFGFDCIPKIWHYGDLLSMSHKLYNFFENKSLDLASET